MVFVIGAGILGGVLGTKAAPSMGLDGSVRSSAFEARYVHHFSSLSVMAGTADLIIVGEVTSVAPGRTVGLVPEEIQFTDVSIKVAELWKGQLGGDSTTIESLELQSFDPEWRVVGASVLLFLSDGNEEAMGRYHLTNDQAGYLVKGNDVVAVSKDPLARLIEAVTLDDLRSQVKDRN